LIHIIIYFCDLYIIDQFAYSFHSNLLSFVCNYLCVIKSLVAMVGMTSEGVIFILMDLFSFFKNKQIMDEINESTEMRVNTGGMMAAAEAGDLVGQSTAGTASGLIRRRATSPR
jgi:hypothetical protein